MEARLGFGVKAFSRQEKMTRNSLQCFGDANMVRGATSPCRWLLPALLAVSFTAVDVTAQTSSGAIAGNIQDASGAVIQNATVTATNDATHTSSVTKSTSAGAYRFPNIPLGTYTVTVVAPGVSTSTQTCVIVHISSTTALDI